MPKPTRASSSAKPSETPPAPVAAPGSAKAARPVTPEYPDPVDNTATFVLREQVHSAFVTAKKLGLPGRRFLEMVSADARPFIEEELRDGYATPEEGLAQLLRAEGGCVDVAEARFLFHKPKGVSRQAMSEKIRGREIIAHRTGTDRWVVPVWQFRPQGGLLKGLPEVLKKIRETLPYADELFPFTFFLQPDPVTGGRTPLEALRAGDVAAVLTAVEGYLG